MEEEGVVSDLRGMTTASVVIMMISVLKVHLLHLVM